MSRLRPGSTVADRGDDLMPLGVADSVGACASVPPGLHGAGRFKVASDNASVLSDLPLVADGQGTFALGTATSSVALQGGPEGLRYVPNGAPQPGGRLLVAELNTSAAVAYTIDGIGNPIAGSRQVVIPSTKASPSRSVASSIGGLAAGGNQLHWPTNDLTILQSLDMLLVSVLDASGQGGLSLGIPANPLLSYKWRYVHSAGLDPITPSGFRASAGLAVRIR